MSNGEIRNVPEQMKAFAKQLGSFNNLLGTESKKLKGQFRRLGDTWKDRDYHKFTQEFDALMKSIDAYLKNAEAHPKLITRKAEKYIEGQNMPT